MVALFNLKVEQMDAVTTFLNSKADTNIYVQLPPGFEEFENQNIKLPQSIICKLLKALYGLKQAPRLWQQMLTESLQKNGFKPCKSDPCVYFNKQTNIIIVTYVDDILIIGLSLANIYRL